MAPLDRLLELAGIAEQDEAIGSLRDGEHISERHLCRLVDEQNVDGTFCVGSRPKPRGCSTKLNITLQCVEEFRIACRDRHARPVWLLVRELLHAANGMPIPTGGDDGFVKQFTNDGMAVRR